MEVKNQAMDQLLVNTAAPAPARDSVRTDKDTDRPDFDTMVQKRTAEKDAPKAAKPAKAEKAEKAETAKAEPAANAQAEEAPVVGDQLALAAALMMQVPPDGYRFAEIQPELVAAENVVTVEAVPDAVTDAPVELPETQAAEVELPAETETFAAAVETAVSTVSEAPAEKTVTAEQPVEAKREAPVEQRAEVRPEAKPETEKAPEAKVTEQNSQPAAQRASEDETPRTQRVVRSEAHVETDVEETPDEAVPAAPEAPVFDRVETTVVKVAEAPKEIPLEAEDGMEQLGEVIVNSVDENRVEVQLTPENLGKLTVEITRHSDGTLGVVLHTESQRAANLLEKGVDGLRQALAGSRQQDVQIEVRGSEESQRQFLNPDGQNEQNRQQQQQQRNNRRNDQHNAQDFLQQLRLGLVDVDNNE